MKKSTLHNVEMRLVYLLEEGNLDREQIINEFTDLISDAEE